MAGGILPGVVAREFLIGQRCIDVSGGESGGRHMVQAVATTMDFAAVKGLLVLIVIRLPMEFEPVNRRGVKDRDVGELNRDKHNHSEQ